MNNFTSFQLLCIVGFVAYILVLILIGYVSSRRKSKGEGFITGGKALTFFPLVGTIGATMIGTALSIGATSNGYRFGWGGSIFAFGSTIGLLSLLIFTPMRKYGFNTMPEEAQFYYGGKKLVRYVASVMMLVTEMIWVGNAINGGAQYIAYVMGCDLFAAKTITTLAFIGFIIFGGYLSVVWTDTVQFGIIIVGFLIMAVKAIPAAGGFQAIENAYAAAGNSGALGFYGLQSYGVLAALSLVVSAYFGAVATQSFRIRIYTSENAKTASRSFVISALMIFCFSLMPSIIGMSAFTIVSNSGTPLASADYAFTFMATTVLAPALGLFFMIAGISATLSSADSNAISGITILLQDLYPVIRGHAVPENRYKLYSRLGLAAVVFPAYLMSLYAVDVMGYIANVAGSILPGIGVSMLLGRLWKRATWQGGLACIFTGTTVGVLYLLVPPFAALLSGIFHGASIPATLLPFALGVIVSLLTPANKLSEDERIALVMASRYRNES